MSSPRPRPVLRPCARCAGTRFLRVSPVREHGHAGEPTPMAASYVERPRQLGPLARAVSCVGPKLELHPVGSFAIVICASCGEARWYARDLDSEASFADAAIGACEDCGEARARCLGRLKTRGRGGQPSELRVVTWSSRRWGFTSTSSAGAFSCFACRGCGRARFLAGGLDTAQVRARERTREAAGADPCPRCAARTRLVVDPVNEDGATLRVLYDRQHLDEVRIGRYTLSICTGCGITDWRARDIEALRPNPSLGVAQLDAGDGGEGPYR